jgi:hypothetical protein
MTGLASILLSIGVLAAFALAGGGIYLIVKGGNRKQGLLMLMAATVTFANVLLWTV